MQSDWLSPDFLALIGKAIKEQHGGGKYHYFMDGGQASGFLFLTDQQYQLIVGKYPDFFPEY